MLLEEMPAAQERLRLLIVGDGNSRRNASRCCAKPERKPLPGFQVNEPIYRELMRAMDLFVLPSLGEGISNTILEAMSTGLPVVATSVGGNVELVKEGVTGMLVSPDEPAAMMEAILKYYRNPDLIANHGKAARQHIETSFSMEAMTARLSAGL